MTLVQILDNLETTFNDFIFSFKNKTAWITDFFNNLKVQVLPFETTKLLYNDEITSNLVLKILLNYWPKYGIFRTKLEFLDSTEIMNTSETVSNNIGYGGFDSHNQDGVFQNSGMSRELNDNYRKYEFLCKEIYNELEKCGNELIDNCLISYIDINEW